MICCMDLKGDFFLAFRGVGAGCPDFVDSLDRIGGQIHQHLLYLNLVGAQSDGIFWEFLNEIHPLMLELRLHDVIEVIDDALESYW